MKPGTRVDTAHGAGTVTGWETCCERVGSTTIVTTGRLGVQLDVWPFAWAGTVAYFFLDELKETHG